MVDVYGGTKDDAVLSNEAFRFGFYLYNTPALGIGEPRSINSWNGRVGGGLAV